MSKKCVLVIDDDAAEAEIIVSQLEDSTVSIVHVATGREALALLMGIDQGEDFERFDPHAILVRNLLPDMTAYEICNVLRNYYRFGKTKFYVITGPEHKTFTSGYDALLFAGKIEQPIAIGSKGINTLQEVKDTLRSDKSAVLFPIMTLHTWKSGKFVVKSIFSGALKIGAVAVCIGSITFVADKRDNNSDLNKIQMPKSHVWSARASPVENIPEVPEQKLVPEHKVVIQIEHEEAERLADTVVNIAAVAGTVDTVREEKVIRIGFRPVHGTK